MGVLLAFGYIIYKSSRVETPTGSIVDALLFQFQTVDLVIPTHTVLSRFVEFVSLQLGSGTATSVSGVCPWHMNGVGEVTLRQQRHTMQPSDQPTHDMLV